MRLGFGSSRKRKGIRLTCDCLEGALEVLKVGWEGRIEERLIHVYAILRMVLLILVREMRFVVATRRLYDRSGQIGRDVSGDFIAVLGEYLQNSPILLRTTVSTDEFRAENGIGVSFRWQVCLTFLVPLPGLAAQ
jgi:hypothetical protein